MLAGRASARSRGAGGWLAALLGCVLVLGAAAVAINAASDTFARDTRNASISFFNLGTIFQIKDWRNRGVPPGGLTGVVLGDSVFAPMTSKARFASALEPALRKAGLHVNLLDLARPGYSPFQYYYLVNRVAAGRPDFAIVEVNLRVFAADWYRDPFHRMLPMAAGLTPRQVWRVHQALATQDVGFLTPFQFRLDARLGGVLYMIEGVRSFGIGMLNAAGRWANRALGLRVRSAADLEQVSLAKWVSLSAGHADLWYGHDFVSTPTAEVLRAFSEQLRDAGVVVLYVVAPVQRERLRSFGMSLDDLHERTERLREMMGASPDEWLDTASLFQSSDFADGVHVHGELLARMARTVAERVASLMASRERAAGNPENRAAARP